MQKHVLIVDDNTTNLKLAENTLKPHYRVTLLVSGEQALKFLTKNRPDLILLDILMPGMDGFETIRHIKANPYTKDIPVIFLTAKSESISEVNALNLGAADFIAKPFVPEIMLRRVSMQIELSLYRNQLEQMVKEQTHIVEKLQDVLVSSITDLVEFRDKVTGGHAKRTGKYFEVFVNYLKTLPQYAPILTQDVIIDMLRAAPLHDVGKVGINDNVLTKNSVLDNQEFAYMQQHTILGGLAFEKALEELPDNRFLHIARDMALCHHERWSGQGYPNGLVGEQIPIAARIMSIVDVYDALTTKRSYKEPYSHDSAVNLMMQLRGDHFDPTLADAFYQCSEAFRNLLQSFEED